MSASGGGGNGAVSNAPVRNNISVTSINYSANTVAMTNDHLPTIKNENIATAPTHDNGTAAVLATTGGAIITNGTSDTSGTSTLNISNGNHFYGNGSIRISVPKMDESDESETELSHIESTAAAAAAASVTTVNMRASNYNKTGPRPMSWEGELSENEDPMDSDSVPMANIDRSSSSSQPIAMTTALAAATTATNVTTTAAPATPMAVTTENMAKSSMADDENVLTLTRDTIKPEVNEFSGGDATAGAISFAQSATKQRYSVDMSNLKYEPGTGPDAGSSVNSPLLARSKNTLLPANPSPDSAIHSVYTHSSPSQSPLTSRHAPYTPSLSRNNSDASYSSCYSYSSEFSPTHSPIQGRHNMYNNFNGSPLHHSVLYKPMVDGGDNAKFQTQTHDDALLEAEAIPSAGISRQQLINSPCPICGDKISGFHYGIFSCESCKGFFKRTVQNRKNYVCLRGGPCPITIATRKKCPACRFDKCLQRGMKLEAIREDRTRGGRSTYQCSYTLPMLSPSLVDGTLLISNNRLKSTNPQDGASPNAAGRQNIPTLLQEIMDVEHLWKYSEAEFNKINENNANANGSSAGTSNVANIATNPLLASAGLANGDDSNPDLIANLCNVADHRLYKIVKWCKSLPLFKHISIDDQICLLINSWCELLLFSCCFRSISTPGEVRISLGKSINLEQAKFSGLQACIERMLNLTDHLRRLRVDKYEYVAMKVIVLLQSDTSDLREPENVRACQEKALQALQAYTLAHYPDSPSKFGELLLRIPELQRTCQVGKEMLTIKSKDGGEFNLLMELLRGEH